MRAFVLLAFAAVLALCGAAPALAQTKPLIVFAAASLKGPLDAAVTRWSAEGGAPVTISYAASNALARQIEQGAPADLFISADFDWMDWAQARGLIQPQTRKTLLANDLVLIAPADASIQIALEKGAPLAAALGDSRLATGQIDAVPAGRYAKQALTSLCLWEEIAPRVAGAESVRAALQLVARGEARLGIVYGSDAKTEPKVKVVARFPENSHAPILYPSAVTAAGDPRAAALLAGLSSPASTAIFEAAGFRAPAP